MRSFPERRIHEDAHERHLIPRTSCHSTTPQVSIALRNRCDLACAHCYAPKSRDELRFDTITRWLAELDAHGTLGIGFGGGERTLYPEFVKICCVA